MSLSFPAVSNHVPESLPDMDDDEQPFMAAELSKCRETVRMFNATWLLPSATSRTESVNRLEEG